MAPTAEALENELRAGVRAIIADRGWEQVTVNNVRQYVEEKGDMDKGFFKTSEWEARSKKVIKDCVVEVLEEEEKAAAAAAAKNGVKRQPSDEPSPAPKRQKKSKPKKEEPELELEDFWNGTGYWAPPEMKEDSDSELSDLDSSEDEPKNTKSQKLASGRKSKKEDTSSELSDLDSSEGEPKKKTKVSKKAAPRRKSKDAPKRDETDSDSEDSPAAKKRKRSVPAKKRTAKHAKVESDGEDGSADEKNEAPKAESDMDVDGDAHQQSKSEMKVKTAPKKEESDSDAKPKTTGSDGNKGTNVDDSDSELSSVIDDPPPKKRQSKGASKSKQAKEPSGDEVEVKKLQGQLVKCGVRKIWGIELKKYGDDMKGKIRHLKEMLRDIGMDGRFSEAKAKEIKERRELMADLEAVTEMNRNWGSGGGHARASRSHAAAKKSIQEDPEEAEDDEDARDEEDNEEEGTSKANPRVSKRMADLAFLGSDSESD
ncbi:hypothetical protein F5Y04DRAFT_252715 [Hypomontagnella monticulosa]|nr:hypothetical protein F5Y04DRAFT_252715 [Hypomontagnella monticulosa]